MAKPQKKEKDSPKKTEKKLPFSTQEMSVVSNLSRNGIRPVSQAGSPMVFVYDENDTDKINSILKN